MLDLVILVEKKYVNPDKKDWYQANIAEEDEILLAAAESIGLRGRRVAWDDASFDWTQTKVVLIREIWDYFHRIDSFLFWLEKTASKTRIINSPEIIRWNQDKHYLRDIEQNGVKIVPTIFIERNSTVSLKQLVQKSGWTTSILKPCISGAARHTYKITPENITEHESILQELLNAEAMMLQPFITSITTKGEISLVIINGKYQHAVIKNAKEGDFRVQDDWGGTLTEYFPTKDEIDLAEKIVQQACPETLYARVDLVWGKSNDLWVGELELIEPELWFRKNPTAALELMKGIKQLIS